MSNFEIFLLVISCLLTMSTSALTLWYRELSRKNQTLIDEVDRIDELLDLAKEKNELLAKQLHESDRKAKLSGDVLAVLADMKQGGAVLEVTRVDRNDIFFHNGGAYR